MMIPDILEGISLIPSGDAVPPTVVGSQFVDVIQSGDCRRQLAYTVEFTLITLAVDRPSLCAILLGDVGRN